MYTEEELTKLEENHHLNTMEAIAMMVIILAETHQTLEKELREFYHKYGKDGVVTYREARKWVSGKDHRKRLTVLYLFVTEVLGESETRLKPLFEELLRGIAADEGKFFNTELNDERILGTPWGNDEKTWDERLMDDVALWITVMCGDLKRNTLCQKHIDEVLEELAESFSRMNRVLSTLVLTESTAYGSISRYEVFRELGASKYQFYTRPDERRCETCGEMHGLVFPMSAYEVGVTASPMHPRCRCWEVPIFD